MDVYPHDMEPGSVSDNWECDLRGCPNTLLTPHIGKPPSPPMLAPLMRHRWRRVLTRGALFFLALLQVALPKRRRRQSA